MRNYTAIDQLKLSEKADMLAEKVAPVYQCLNWKWRDADIPTKEEIKTELIRLANDLMKEKRTISLGTGGLSVSRTIDEIGQTIYQLEFVISFEV